MACHRNVPPVCSPNSRKCKEPYASGAPAFTAGLTSKCSMNTLACMARTTLMIEDSLLRLLKKKAAEEGRTLQDVANEALRRGLTQRMSRSGYSLTLQGWEAAEQPGVDILDRDKLFDLMDGR